jgi:CheY-like chemotaxis protein
MNNGPRTVLVVDDDPQVLRLLEQMLGSQDVNVMVAPKAADALQICERQPVHLLISDIAMPGMDGAKLAERVLKLHPKAAVLLISGQYQEAPPNKSPQIRFLRKPFFPSELIEHLRELLPSLPQT